jgi:hypothetical protein
MSQNILNTEVRGVPVTVIAGWDNPLQQVFCGLVPSRDISDEASEAKDLPDFSDMMLESFACAQDIATRLQDYGIALPQAMLEAIDGDVVTRARNVVRVFDASGARLR